MRSTVVAIALVLAACVPASEELPAAGAAGFDTVPSAQTAGETFTTSDGWNVTFEKLFIQLTVSASPVSLGYGSAETFVFDAQKPARMFVRALPVGPARVSTALYGRYLGYDDDDFIDGVERINVDDETNGRFNRPPEDGEQTRFTPGPSMVLVVRAERGGHVVTLDLALSVATTFGRDLEFGSSIEIREDQLASLPLPINAESIFPVFDDIVECDRDFDGRVTARELEEGRVLPQLEQRMAAVVR